MRPETVIKMSVQRMACTACGAEANASCNCGKPYVPAKQRAAEAIAANPQRSDGAIASELGVDRSTVTRARAETGGADALPEREGLDGKVYRLPVREERAVDPKQEIVDEFFTVVDLALRISDVDLSAIKPTADMRKAAQRVIAAWADAERKLL